MKPKIGAGLRACAALLSLPLVMLLGACSGNYGGGDAAQGTPVDSPQPRSVQEHFSRNVQPRLEFCRTCHTPDGVANVENGRDFMLSTRAAEDLENLEASWTRLGGNNPVSRILKMASGQETPHSGGMPWAPGSEAYKAMEVLLKCFADSSGCAALLGSIGGGSVSELPLLGSKRGGHAWFDFCEGKGDGVALPPDPRSLVQPGVNQGKAVYFNAFWKDCHADPALVGERPHPKTCGELRESHARGAVLMKGNGAVGAGNFFAATGEGGAFSTTAENYNRLWQLWGLDSRPDNFDDLVAERFGVPRSYERNPYPLPGEDPNATNGGSGQLPANLTQTRTADGQWSGRIGLNCHGCHSGQIGVPEDGPGLGLVYGSGNPNGDVSVIAREMALTGAPAISVFALFSTQRGTNNAAFFNIAALGGVRPDLSLIDVLRSGSNASGDNPAWWNVGHRPLKFWNGSFPADAVRVDLAFFTPLGGDASDFVSTHAQHADHWILSQKAPAYPKPIDTALAEQGAVLFHSKDLWAEGLDNPAERPAGGNGSCASCHGAYSPRFVNDPAYLDTPLLEGIASYVAPRAVIRTDFARASTDNEGVSQALSRTSIGYPETAGAGPERDCGTQTRAATRGEHREIGYLAPPLYGVWATAPYLHNGSVPDAWTLLKPEDRPRLWRRVSTPARPDQQGKVVMGFDTNIDRAYDTQKLGWKYDRLSCGMGTIPFLQCDPLAPDQDAAAQRLLALLYGNLLAAWNVGNVVSLAQFTPQQIEDRKIYNTHLFSQGNEGHDFTAVLTDAERRALIEYLKTL